jgi:phosphatidyl-myo-inositol dimannoside synthase
MASLRKLRPVVRRFIARHLVRRVKRQVRAVPRRSRKALRIAITYAQTSAAVRQDQLKQPERALTLLADAARRSPADMRVAKFHAQVLSRTGRLDQALGEASRLAIATQEPKDIRLQRALQGRWIDTDAAWAPVVPGPAPAVQPLPARVLYLAKESMPHRNNGYCTRTHETLLAVRAAGREPVAVTLPGFPAAVAAQEPVEPVSRVDQIEYHHVLPGAQSLLDELSWEEYVQMTTTAFAREVVRVRPAVLHAGSGHRGYDLGAVGRALSDWAGLPWLYEVRSFFETTWTADERYAESAPYYHRRFEAESRAMRAADAVVTLSGPMRDEIVNEHGVDPGRVFVIPNAVDLDRFEAAPRDQAMRSRLGLDGTFVLGYISNLDHYREGQEVLLRAAAALRAQGHQVSVLLVGEGRRREELMALAADLGLGAAAVFPGNVPFDEIPAWYSQIDLFVVPRVPERAGRMVSPMKPFEAMAMQVPVMVSDLPALVEIAGPEQERAFVFEAGRPESLAAAVAPLITAPEVLAARVAAAEDWVRRERTWAANGTAFDEVYRFAAARYAERAGVPVARRAAAGGVR